MATIEDWASEIGFYDDPLSQYKRVLVYGETGSGKTKLGSTFPNVFCLDYDKGGVTLKDAHIPNIKFKRGNKTYKETMDVLKKIKDKEKPFDEYQIDSILLDGITALADYLLVDIMKYPRIPGKVSRQLVNSKAEWDDYSLLAEELKSILKYIQDMPVNLIATCGVKLEKDEVTGGYIGQPSIVGGFRSVVGHEFDEMYFMESVQRGGEKIEYITHFQKSGYFASKSRFGLTGSMKDATFDKLFGKGDNT